MNKAIVHLGYTDYILDADKALTVLGLLKDAEVFEEKWKSTEDGGNTYHVYPQEMGRVDRWKMTLLTDQMYKLAKLAGKPE